VAGTPVPPFLSRDGQDIVHENPEQKYLNANKIIEIKKKQLRSDGAHVCPGNLVDSKEW
jgi:hypothetical protein